MVKQYDAKLRTAQEQMVKLQQSLQAAKGREENGVKLMEEKLKASQNQISTLLKTLKGKEASWQTKDQENVRQFNEKMKAAQENISSLQAALKAKDEDDGRSKFYEEKSKLLEDNLKAKDYNLASLKEKLMQADRDSQEDKVRLGQMEQIVKSLEEKQVNTESKMKLAEQETKKLREERVMKERTVKENFKKMEIKIKSTDQAIALLEKKKSEAELNGQNAEAEKMRMEEEMLATREKMNKMEFDCSEALTKFRDLQERVTEADRRYLESEREAGELRNNCEEHLEQYEHAISNKTR